MEKRRAKRSPFFAYVGWTLPHGPDADRSLREKAIEYTPAGKWKTSAALNSVTRTTRNEVRALAAKAAEAAEANGRHPTGHQGHKDYALALSWLDRGVGTVLWALQKKGIMRSTLLSFTSE